MLIGGSPKKAAAVSPELKTETVGSSIPVGEVSKMKQKCRIFRERKDVEEEDKKRVVSTNNETQIEMNK